MFKDVANKVSHYVDSLDQKVGAMLKEEFALLDDQKVVFGKPYLRASRALIQFIDMFLNFTKLIKNILLFVGTLLLASAALLRDWNVARQLGIMAVGRATLVALNLTNALFSFVSIFANTAAAFVNKAALLVRDADEAKEEKLEKDQFNLDRRVLKGFFPAVEAPKKFDSSSSFKALEGSSFESTESALNSIGNAYGLPTFS